MLLRTRILAKTIVPMKLEATNDFTVSSSLKIHASSVDHYRKTPKKEVKMYLYIDNNY